MEPEIGMPATYSIGSDDYPYTVIGVKRFKNGEVQSIQLQQDTEILVSGSTEDGSAQFTYEPNPNGHVIVAKPWTSNGYKYWKVVNGSAIIYLGQRRYYRDPSF